MLEILGKRTSLNVRKVLWVCHEIGLPFNLQEWGSGHQATETPEFLALNPNALVPVIRDDSFVLWESNAICRYLCSQYGAELLLPTAPRERAKVEQWMDWQSTELNNSWRYAFMALVRKSAMHSDPRAVEASLVNWNRHMRILDDQINLTRGYATGDSFTLADVVLGLSVNRWFLTPMQRPALKAVSDYYERLSKRDGFLVFGRNGTP